MSKQRNVTDEGLTSNPQNKCEKIENISYDQLLQSAGEMGKYQVFLFFCTFPFYVSGVFVFFSQIFLTEVSPQHWCWIPELENLTDVQRRNLAIPLDQNSPYGYSRCQAFDANWTELLSSGTKPDETWKKVPCHNGWEFNKTEFAYFTIGSEFGWVCEKDSYQATAQSFFFLGSIIGGFLMGWISDRFGRLPAAVFSNILGAVAGSVTAFTQNFLQFTICRFIMGMAYDSCMMMVYLIILEYTSSKYRTVMTNLSLAIFFTIGAVALPWISLACGYWRVVALVTSLPMTLSILAPFVIPESPRWLLSKGKIDETINKILKIGQVNKKNVPHDIITKFKQSVLKNKAATGNMIDVFKRPLIRKIFLCTCIAYMCCMIVIDSLIRTIGQLKFDYFVSFTVISLTEFPSLVIVSFGLDFFGRKFILIATMTLCAVFSFMIPFIGGGLPSVLCAVMARFAVNMACNTVMQWTTELLPTSVRGTGSSIVHICGYIANVISPFVAYLNRVVDWLPMIVIGCISVFASIVGLNLPETAKKDMPQTFEAAEELTKNQRLLEFPFLRKRHVSSNLKGVANSSFQLQ